MRVIVARNIGFCPGVSRAIKMAEEILKGGTHDVYSLGPIIHNPQEVERLREMGMVPIPDEERALRSLDVENATLVIRSHGIAPDKRKILEEMGLTILDATCPVVREAQEAAKEVVEQGYLLVIVGSASHPEVLGIVGSVEDEPRVVSSAKEARDLVKEDEESGRLRRVGVISQTTGGLYLLEEVIDELAAAVPELIIRNTICESHLHRQEEAERLAQEADVVLVVGGKNSSNTANLAKLSADAGATTYHIEDETEIRDDWLEDVEVLAILGGASTPKWLVDRVGEKVERIGGNG